MMKNTSQQKSDAPYKSHAASYNVAFREIIKGAASGQAAITVATPLLVMANCISSKKAFKVKMAFRGYWAYSSGVTPAATVAISSHGLMSHYCEKRIADNPINQIIAGTISGALSGAATCTSEAIAQQRQADKSKSSKEIIKKAWRYNGAKGVGAGMGAVVFREGKYHMSYLSIVPLLSRKIEPYVDNKYFSDLISSLIVGGTVGLLSTPEHCTFRFHKQKSMMSKTGIPSYSNIARKVISEADNKNLCSIIRLFFRGGVVRTAAVTAAIIATVFAKNGVEHVEDSLRGHTFSR